MVGKRSGASAAGLTSQPGVLAVRNHVTDDESLTGAVAQALTTDPGTRAAHQQVRVRVGAVELDGRVPTRAAHAAATALATAVPGVVHVRNGAEVAAAPPTRPSMTGRGPIGASVHR